MPKPALRCCSSAPTCPPTLAGTAANTCRRCCCCSPRTHGTAAAASAAAAAPAASSLQASRPVPACPCGDVHSSPLAGQPALSQLLCSPFSKLSCSNVGLPCLWVMCTFDAGVVHQGLEPSHTLKQIPEHLSIIPIICIAATLGGTAASIAASRRSGSSSSRPSCGCGGVCICSRRKHS